MPVDFKKKYIFIHIPKTGGTSLEYKLDLRHRENYHGEGWYEAVYDGIQCAPQHIISKTLKRMLENDGHNWNEFYKFAIVRNPYDRVLSEYFYRYSNMNFDLWLSKFYAIPDTDHKLSQYDYLYDDEGNCLVDKIIKLEELDNGMKEVFEKIGIFDYTIPHKNKSNRKKMHLSEDQKKSIIRYFKKDFENFNYNI